MVGFIFLLFDLLYLLCVVELDGVLDKIGVICLYYIIIFLILIGCLFDVFEQNVIGLVGLLFKQQWGLMVIDIGLFNMVIFVSVVIGCIVFGFVVDCYGWCVMLSLDLLLFILGVGICVLVLDLMVMVVGCVIVGFGFGGEIVIVVIMLVEFCFSKFCGIVVGLVNVGVGGMGNFLVLVFGLLVFMFFFGENSWCWLFFCLMLLVLLGVFYCCYILEMLCFLFFCNKIVEVNQVLVWLVSGKFFGLVL